MKISTLNSKLHLLSVGTNAKTKKGDSEEAITAIQYLAHSLNSGYETCAGKSEGCSAACLFTAGRGAMNSVQQARIKKTKLFFENKELYLTYLNNDLTLLQEYGKEHNMQVYVRLNGTSDLDFISLNIFQKYPTLKFYDYTKIKERLYLFLPENYKLTYSRDERTTNEEILTLINYANIAVVFDEVPSEYLGLPVYEGDLTDLRFEDPLKHIIGLKAKARAKQDTSGFVVKNNISILQVA